MKKTRVSVVAVGAAMALTVTVMTIAPAQSAPSVQTGITKATTPKSVSGVPSSAAGKRRSTVTAKATRSSVVVLQRAKIKGKVNGPSQRKVILQLKNAYGWGNVDKDKTTKKGKYELKVPTKWYGNKKMRVVAPPTRGFQADKNKVQVKVTEGYTPGGKHKSWTRLSEGNKTRYNPCKTIKYAVNPSRLPADGVGVLNEAVFRLELASGLRYKFSGSTKAIPFRAGNGKDTDKKANLSVAWSTASVVPNMAGGVLAIGGFNKTRLIDRRRTYELLKTGVVMDLDYAYADRGFLNGASMGAVVMHELVHATGMGHADKDASQIMFPSIDPARPALYGNGDITGLKKHGRDAGCLSSGNARPAPGAVSELPPTSLP